MQEQNSSSDKYYYIMNSETNVISHGPMSEEQTDLLLKEKFEHNDKFVKVVTSFLHDPGDVLFLNS